MGDKMAADRDELLLDVPADLVRRCKGLAFDIGGSAFKIVYRTEADMKCMMDDADSKFGRLHLVAFPRTEIEEGLNYVRQRAYWSSTGHNDQQMSLSATGVGGVEFDELMSDMMSVRIKSIVEFVCFVKSFHYLAARLPRHQLLEPFLWESVTEPIEFIRSQHKLLSHLRGKDSSQHADSDDFILSTTGRPRADENQPPVESPLSEAEPDMYPCLLAMCGSSNVFFRVEKDGSFHVLNGSCRGGKAFTGVGVLLTGCRNFDKLIELASKGNPRKVDQYTDEVFSSKCTADSDDSLYITTEEAKPGLLYAFGKAAAGDGDFTREDVAAAWLQYVVLDLIQIINLACQNDGIKRVFLCGGFACHPVVRRIMTAEFSRYNMFLSQMHQVNRSITFDFIKPGQYLGALGCLINDIDKEDEDED